MQTHYLNPKQFPKASTGFIKHFDSFLDLCLHSEEQKMGLLFYLGACLPNLLNRLSPLDEEFPKYLQVLSLYSKSSGKFERYGDLSDGILSHWIYNGNLALSKISGENSDIDQHLRSLMGGKVVIGKRPQDDDFLEGFKANSYSLNAMQNFFDTLFLNTGKHFKDCSYSRKRAYEAGFAYRMMMIQMDFRGTNFLLNHIQNNLPPIYQALFYMPVLYVFNPHACKSNHIFSLILNHLYGGENSEMFEVGQIIHVYHQYVFYKESSNQLKSEWLFNSDSEEGSAIKVFETALMILNTNLKRNAEIVKNSGFVYNENLIDATINISDFLEAILEIIHEKYGISGYDEFSTDSDGKWNTIWNNKGDYIQFLVILFYETCLHALVVEKIVV